MKLNQLFADVAAQEQFERDGYIVIDLTTPEIVRHLGRRFYDLNPDIPEGFSSGATEVEERVKKEIFAEMDALLGPPLDRTFINYKKLGSTFLCKAPGDKGHVNVHQDWSVVDESRYASATVWIPTEPVDERNGALRVLPGSHLFFNKLRNTHIPVSYRGSEQLIWDHMLTVPMQPGQAFVLNHAVIHASSANRTERARVVIAYGITSAQAQLTFHYRGPSQPGDLLEKFEMPDDFFLRYHNIGERPLVGVMTGQFDYPVPAVSREEIYGMIRRERERRRDIPYFREHWIEPHASAL
ncbi:MAG: phytanoyl-CoA dioxygenase family protein [Bacteroidetes bacterium]|nr:phytanoyl-CoA dioxygenase family protein [Bacteroidota bacterium]